MRPRAKRREHSSSRAGRGQASWNVKLEKGRRTDLRARSLRRRCRCSVPHAGLAAARRRERETQRGVVVAGAEGGRWGGGERGVPAAGPVRRRSERLCRGVVGFQPIIQIVPEGTQLYARAAISPDRALCPDRGEPGLFRRSPACSISRSLARGVGSAACSSGTLTSAAAQRPHRVQGHPGGGMQGATPPARRRPSRREISEGVSVQAADAVPDVPSSTRGVTQRAVWCDGVINAGSTKRTPVAYHGSSSEALRRQAGCPLTPVAVERWV